MAKSLLVVGGGAIFLQNQTGYFNFAHGNRPVNLASEANSRTPIRTSGTLSQLYVRIATNTSNVTSTLRVRKNGANGNQSISVSAATTGEFSDTSNTDSVSSGDLVCYQMAVPSGTGGIEVSIASMVFDPATQNAIVTHGSNNNAGMSTASVTYYIKILSSEQEPRATESEAQQRAYVPFTLKNFQVIVSTNGRTTTTTYGTRINGANGNQSVSVGSGATGTFHDASNTDSVAATDLVNCFVTTGTGTGTITPSTISCIEETTTGEQHNFSGHGTAGAAGSTINANLTRHSYIAGTMVVETTETRTSMNVPMKGRLKGLGIYVATNTLLAASTFRTRVNAANGNQSISIGIGSTGFFEDTTNVDVLAAGDNINYRIITGATGVSMVVQYMRSVFAFPAPIKVTKSLAYKVSTEHIVTKSLTYEVQTEQAVTKSSTYAVSVEGSISESITYRVSTEHSITKTLAYAVSAKVAVTKNQTYVVVSPASTTLSLKYAVSPEGMVMKSLKYALRVEGAVTKQSKYCVRSSDSSQEGLVYRIVTGTALQLGMAYSVASEESGSKSLTYAVKTATALSLGVVYICQTPQVVINLDLAYSIAVSTGISKSLQYYVRDGIYTPKPMSPYKPFPKLV